MAQNKFFIVIMAILIGGFIWYMASTPQQMDATTAGTVSTDLSKYAKGDINAPVKVVQYSDFLCPSCSQVSLGVVPEIMTQYVDTAKVYYEFVPMAFIASGSQLAAEGAFCAANQNKFWQYHDVSYEKVWNNYFSKGVDPYQVPLYSVDGVKGLGKAAGVDEAIFAKCIDDRQERDAVVALTKQSQANGVSGTPYFTVNGTPIKGVPNYEILDAAIKAQL